MLLGWPESPLLLPIRRDGAEDVLSLYMKSTLVLLADKGRTFWKHPNLLIWLVRKGSVTKVTEVTSVDLFRM